MYAIWSEVQRHAVKLIICDYNIMGNQTNPQYQQALSKTNNQEDKGKEKMFKSPQEAYAVKCQDSIRQMFPKLMKKVEFVQNKQDFPGIAKVVENCPVYFLKSLNCYYQGQWLDCLPHGCGIAVYKNQSFYEGDFEKGQINSEEGFYFFNNGDDKIFEKNVKNKKKVTQSQQSQEQEHQTIKNNKSSYYIGKFVKSKFEGKGKIYHKGVIYEGGWINGKREGEGKQYSHQFDYSFQGNYLNGFKQDHGVYTIKNNNKVFVYQGQFRLGKFHGEGKIQIDNYLYYQGTFAYGKAEGKGQLVLEDGVFKGNFKNNQISGQGEFEYLQKQKSSFKGIFHQMVDRQKCERQLFCDEKSILKDHYYTFPLLLGQN